jgi:uncharacterized protein YcfL
MKAKNSYIPATAVLAVLALMATAQVGCRSRAKKVEKVNQMDTETVVMKDMAVTTNVALKQEWSEMVNGRLKAHLILRNKRNATVQIEVKTIFMDASGIPLRSNMDTWTPVMIGSNEDYHFSRLCPDEAGVKYQFLIKTAGK